MGFLPLQDRDNCKNFTGSAAVAEIMVSDMLQLFLVSSSVQHLNN